MFKKQSALEGLKSQFKIKHECQFELSFYFPVDCDAADCDASLWLWSPEVRVTSSLWRLGITGNELDTRDQTTTANTSHCNILP